MMLIHVDTNFMLPNLTNQSHCNQKMKEHHLIRLKLGDTQPWS